MVVAIMTYAPRSGRSRHMRRGSWPSSECLDILTQYFPGYLSHMHVRQAATGVDEKGDGYPHRPVVPRENAARIQQHVRKGEFLGGQVTLDRDRSFALIDEEELHVLGISRRLRQYRHLPTAGRAPGRPQVDHARLAGVGG